MVSTVSRAIQGLLIARIVLLMFATPAGEPLVRVVMLVTDALISPFRLVVAGQLAIPYSPSILDTTAILALLGYTLIETAVLLGRHLTGPAPAPLPPSPILHPANVRWTAPQADALTPVDVSRVVGGVRRVRER